MTSFQPTDTPPASSAPAHPPSRLTGTRLWASPFLSQEDRHALDDAASSDRSVRSGMTLIHEGDWVDSLFVVARGWACRYTMTPDGARQLPTLLVPGDIGNLDSLMFDHLDYGVRTLSDTTIVALPCDRILELTEEYPGIARTFIWLAMIENVTLGKLALSLGRRSAKDRLAHLICELSVRTGGETGNSSSFAFPLTQETIADALGITSVHLNRMLQQLRADGMIETDNRVMTVPNVSRLRDSAGFDPRYLHIDPPETARSA